MDTNRIKRFATEARNKLKEGIAAKIRTLGFDKKGNVAEEHRPQLMQGGTHWNGQLLPETFYHQWTSLYHRIQQKGISEVYEEAAYTWFNRLCAIRILQKNDLCAPVLDYTDAARTPFIVDEARQGRLPEMNDEMRSRLNDLLDDDTKVTEQFAVLINAWCHDNPIIHSCFGAMADYTELLLPNNILTEGGFVDMLNHTDFITDADYRSPELIGWLYQFYISERKDEVFAKKGKFEADEIPAATQIFTPNWIVKYMVQNTIGRIYLDNNPYETQLQKKWKYLINNVQCTMYNESATPAKPIINSTLSIINYSELEELKVGDLACGSGHILNECFDLLYDLYIAEGYGRGEAIENIFRHNLTGVDLDTRAKQLATFALLLKACQKDNAFADAHCLPNVLDMTGIVPDMNEQELSEACLRFMGGYENVAGEMLEQDFELLRDADNLGSIMMFNDAEDYLAMLRGHYEDWTDGDIEDCPEDIKVLIPGVRLILALSEKYHALVMNPPYMGSGNMNATLSKYVKSNYEEGKADLFSVFMLLAIDRLLPNGKYGMINMQSWMFLSSFEKLRTRLLTENRIDNMLHLGPRTFDELSGEVVQNTAFVITNCEGTHAAGSYYRLIEGKNCGDKERMFLEAKENEGKAIVNSKLYIVNYNNVSQQDFEKIPGCPIGYWVSDNMKEVFSNIPLGENYTIIAGLCTGDNTHYIFNWHEVNRNHTLFPNMPFEDRLFKFHNKGGNSRKWYGNQDFVVKYSTSVFPVLSSLPGFRNDGHDFFYKESISWAKITSTYNTFRYYPNGFVFDSAGSSIFSKGNTSLTLLGFCNSIVARKIVSIINPTINASPGIIKKLPTPDDNDTISMIVSQNISISKQDWDAHETSWDFETNPLLAIGGAVSHCTINDNSDNPCCGETPQLLLEDLMNAYKQKWEHLFMQLHENEEELNRQFIDIYGLQDELTPDVPLDEITILQQGEVSFNL